MRSKFTIKNFRDIWSTLILCNIIYDYSILSIVSFPGTGDAAKYVLIISCFLFYVSSSCVKRRHEMFTLLVIDLSVFIVLYLNGTNLFNALALICRFSAIYLYIYTCLYGNCDWMGQLAYIIYKLAFIYLILYVFINVFHANTNGVATWYYLKTGARDNPSNGSIYVTTYYNIYFLIQKIDIFGTSIPRNTAIFAEAGLYQVLLNYSLFYYLFIRKEKNKLCKFILSISVLTCTSVMGILILLTMYIFYLTSLKKSIVNGKYIYSGIIIYFSLAVIASLIIFSYKKGLSSYNQRLDDISNFIRRIKGNWLIGMGLNKSGFSANGILIAINDLGILGLYTLIVPNVLKRIFSNEYCKSAGLAMLVLMFLSIFNEPITYNDLFFLFVTYACVAINYFKWESTRMVSE